MIGKGYGTDDDVINAVSSYVEGLSEEFYQNRIKALKRRWKVRVNIKGTNYMLEVRKNVFVSWRLKIFQPPLVYRHTWRLTGVVNTTTTNLAQRESTLRCQHVQETIKLHTSWQHKTSDTSICIICFENASVCSSALHIVVYALVAGVDNDSESLQIQLDTNRVFFIPQDQKSICLTCFLRCSS